VAALKGTKDIGEQIDIAIGKIAKANDLHNIIIWSPSTMRRYLQILLN
jgi:hypothetical protein